jgi:hypothetical protein
MILKASRARRRARGAVLAGVLGVIVIAITLAACGGDGGGGSGGEPPPPHITAASPPAGTTGTVYAGYTFTASGGTPPLSWSEAGSLPPGLTLSVTGQLAGDPVTAGSYPINVKVTDSSAQPLTATVAVSLKINDSTIGIAPASPPAGTVTNTYPGFTFSASGGSPPYTWRASGALPPGLTLGSGGTVTGTPTQAGSFSFSVTATDSAQTPTSSPPLTTRISISNPPPPMINSQEAPTGTVGTAYTYQFTASGGLAPLLWSETPALMMGLALSTQGALSGTPTAAGQFPITVNAMDAASQSAPPFPTVVRVSLARPPASFTATGSMAIPRAGHAATLLLSGSVLVTGGNTGLNLLAGPLDPTATAELYDPATGTFSPTTGEMTEARSGHAATLLDLGSSSAPGYGKVLIVGSGDPTAELYNPATGTFAATGSLNHARLSPTATLLNTGMVLVVGDSTSANDASAELYNPASGTFSFTGSTTVARTGQSATLLLDGRVLIAGGGTKTAELYDPSSGTFTATAGSMTESRSGHRATLLGAADGAQQGYVLIIGTDGSADLYDPGTQTFARVGSLPPCAQSASARTATLRSDGTVLTAGGWGGGCLRLGGFASKTAAALFAPESDGFTVTGSLNKARDTHTATLLQDGTVVVIGGLVRDCEWIESMDRQYCAPRFVSILSSAELFKTVQ